MLSSKIFRANGLLRKIELKSPLCLRTLTSYGREEKQMNIDTRMDGVLLRQVLNLTLKESSATNVDGDSKVVEFKHPNELQDLLKLNISQNGLSIDEVMKVLDEVVRFSVKTSHPHFYNQLYGGIDEIGLAASWISSTLNTNQHTYEIAPVFILMEHYLIKYLAKLFGWSDGDGIFSPGGSMSNMYAMQLARYRLYPDSKVEGIFGNKPLTAFTSDQACWGGTAILSQKYKHNLEGIHRVDSIAWNPHKMLGAPLQCSTFIVKHKGLLHECNSAKASYLFQQDKFYDVSFDTGDKSFQCGRKVDAFKLYLLLSSHGLSEIERRVDAAFRASEYLYEQVKNRPDFRAVIDRPQCTNVCFWYIPPSLQQQPETPEWWDHLSKVAPKLKARMVQNGELMIGYQPIQDKGLVNFFRLVNCCIPCPTNEQMDQVLEIIQRLGEDL
ncbi:cysteine sulfinic acid decarboxylase-like isoform X2 [Palaemon carinicauda]|uniref:cysteine sulfinic acid decarboxylase-like isoform X2 n=1 Tax=Palaemon carinicauda TaxID=392227 RepID=UPI0035B5F9A7